MTGLPGERPKGDLRVAVAIFIKRRRELLTIPRRFPPRAAKQDNSYGCARSDGKKMTHQLDRALIGPVQIFKHQPHRFLCGQTQEKSLQDREKSGPKGLSRHRSNDRRLFGIQAHGEQLRQNRVDLLLAGKNLVEPGAQTGACLSLAVLVRDAGITPQKIQKRSVTERAAEGKGAALEPGQVAPFALSDLRDQATFADPGLAENHHDLSSTPLKFFQALDQPLTLALSAHERRSETFHATRFVRLNFRVEKLVDIQRITFALDLDRFHFLKCKGPDRKSVSIPTYKNLTGFCRALEPGGSIDRVADHRVAHPEIAPHISRDDHSGVHPDMEIQRLTQFFDPAPVQTLEALPHGKRCTERAIRIVLESHRSPKDRHDAIPDEFINHPLVLVNGQDQFFQTVVNQRGDLLRVEALGKRRET